MNKPIGFFFLLLMAACQSKPEAKKVDLNSSVCFQAIDGKDTAYMELDTLKYYDIKGKMRFHYSDTSNYVGEFKGEMKGDTLRGFFEFQLNGGEYWHRNPVAFLKKQGNLVMGEGKFVLIWGSGYFDPAVPIDYSRAKFIFKPISCP